ncbi:MAG: alpha/beta hydrolase, partial [Eubacteriales bacterium]|nr:alpha/beta hydrolase [Eubacteriales bacterium]
EHIERYERLAKRLEEAGIITAGFNLAGHGEECPKERLGVFDKKDGWNHMLKDVYNAREILIKKYPDIPLIMLGHSMGSFLLRCYIQKYTDGLPDMLVLCGTGYYGAPVLQAGVFLAGLLGSFGKRNSPSNTISKIVFPQDKQAQTPFDWLTRDSKEVEKYIKDPLCGFPLSAGAYQDFFKGVLMLTHEERISPAKPKMPVYFIAGEKDPIGKNNGVQKVADNFRTAGYKDITVKLYAEARHELFNELNRDSVTDDLIMWIDKYISKDNIKEV